MDSRNCREQLRNSILAIYPVRENALIDILNATVSENILQNEFFCSAGDYSLFFAFVCNGCFRSYYRDSKDNEYCTGFYCHHMFMLPLPAFLYRKPAFQYFQALQDSTILKIKYADIEELARRHDSVSAFLRKLIEREWIVKKELNLASKYIYNHQTRYRLFVDQFQEQVHQIPVKYISSYLNIPEKQIQKFMDT